MKRLEEIVNEAVEINDDGSEMDGYSFIMLTTCAIHTMVFFIAFYIFYKFWRFINLNGGLTTVLLFQPRNGAGFFLVEFKKMFLDFITTLFLTCVEPSYYEENVYPICVKSELYLSSVDFCDKIELKKRYRCGRF